MAFMLDPRLEISVGSGLDESNSHGFLWIDVVENNKLTRKRAFFTLNKPRCVRQGLSYGMWSALKRQITKMGLAATHMEIFVRNRNEVKTYCYEVSKYNELFSGAVGSSVVRLGVA